MTLAERLAAALSLAGVLVFLVACRTSRSYGEAAGPRWSGGPATAAPVARDTLRVVTWNIEFARSTDAAIRMLTDDAALRRADLVMLQEMTADSTERVARALGMWWVYYPAVHSSRVRQDVGNAVLSRWPIVADAKVILPHRSRYANTHRIATAATIQLGDRQLRVYSTHLGTPLDIGRGARRAQLRAVLEHAAAHDVAIVAGDLNDSRVGASARDLGWSWATAEGPTTVRGLGRVDHVFVRGLGVAASGTGPAAWRVSDHRAVWVDVVLPVRPGSVRE